MQQFAKVTPEEQIQKALDTSMQAQGLLDNAAFQDACSRLEAHYISAWRNSKPADQQAREDAWMMLRALEEVKGNLKTAAAAGGIVSYNLRRTITEKAR